LDPVSRTLLKIISETSIEIGSELEDMISDGGVREGMALAKCCADLAYAIAKISC
jgi:hypothetical protein